MASQPACQPASLLAEAALPAQIDFRGTSPPTVVAMDAHRFSTASPGTSPYLVWVSWDLSSRTTARPAGLLELELDLDSGAREFVRYRSGALP